MPAVTLALILGTIIGEALRIEDQINFASLRLKTLIERITNTAAADNDAYISRFVGLLMLFCTGSTGILGAIGEGVNGDSTVLLTKSVMDIFAAFAFAAHMGPMIACIAIPQFLFFSILFWSAGFIMPLTDPLMIGDFMACGGILRRETAIPRPPRWPAAQPICAGSFFSFAPTCFSSWDASPCRRCSVWDPTLRSAASEDVCTT